MGGQYSTGHQTLTAYVCTLNSSERVATNISWQVLGLRLKYQDLTSGPLRLVFATYQALNPRPDGYHPSTS
jgi:hypothetical protein